MIWEGRFYKVSIQLTKMLRLHAGRPTKAWAYRPHMPDPFEQGKFTANDSERWNGLVFVIGMDGGWGMMLWCREWWWLYEVACAVTCRVEPPSTLNQALWASLGREFHLWFPGHRNFRSKYLSNFLNDFSLPKAGPPRFVFIFSRFVALDTCTGIGHWHR
jgi:hypothetical protein